MMRHTTGRGIIILLIAAICLPSIRGLSDPATRPLILIYTPEQPGYGNALASMIAEDDRLDADILVLQSQDLFRSMIYLPYVKVIVVSLFKENPPQEWGEDINWFFGQGGGVVGLGFAGSCRATGNASRLAFPLFANESRAGSYDPRKKSFTITFVKGQPHEISEGLSDFSINAQKICLSWRVAERRYLPQKPDRGSWTVLYRDSAYGAPAWRRGLQQKLLVLRPLHRHRGVQKALYQLRRLGLD